MKKKVLLVGASQMAVDYFNVLQALDCDVVVVGRGRESALVFEEKTGAKVILGGLEGFLKNNSSNFDEVIVAVGMEQLAATTIQLINNEVKNILVEKPAGLNTKEIQNLYSQAFSKGVNVLVAYNRRFFASVLKAKNLIQDDGGVTSFNFEFTEWAHTIEPLNKKPGIKENWLLANSTHVIDLAFYLGGSPNKITCFAEGELSWHSKAIFSGAGITKERALFSYQANWNAPGRWGVEILTNERRFYFRPMEKLFVQEKGSVAVTEVEIDDSLDIEFKPGLYRQTEAFLNGNMSEFNTLKEQVAMLKVYSDIVKGNNLNITE